jgi:hypothetical protein
MVVERSSVVSVSQGKTWVAARQRGGTLLPVEPGWVACGHVPGTPEQQVGEMQYVCSRGGG